MSRSRLKKRIASVILQMTHGHHNEYRSKRKEIKNNEKDDYIGFLVLFLMSLCAGCGKKTEPGSAQETIEEMVVDYGSYALDYGVAENWAYFELGEENRGRSFCIRPHVSALRKYSSVP